MVWPPIKITQIFFKVIITKLLNETWTLKYKKGTDIFTFPDFDSCMKHIYTKKSIYK